MIRRCFNYLFPFRRYSLLVLVFVSLYLAFLTGLNYANLPIVHWGFLAIVFCLVVLVDQILTKKGLSLGAKEMNPIANFLFSRIGLFLGMGILWLIFGVYLFLFFSKGSVASQVAVILAYSVIPMNNILVLRQQRRLSL